MYLKLNKQLNVKKAAEACGDYESSINNNKTWASYLYYKYRSNNSSYRCSSNSTTISEGSNFSYCYNAKISTSDTNFPYGIIGNQTYSTIDFRYNTIDSLDFLTGIKSTTGHFYIDKTSDLSALSTMHTVGGTLSIANTSITNLDFLSNIRNVTSLLITNNSQLTDISALSISNDVVNLDLSGNMNLSDISNLASINNINGSLYLQNTNINNYLTLTNLNVNGSITTDLFDVSTILPTNGNWCLNEIYLKLNHVANQEMAATKCN
jgi:hypothetical protein